MNHSEQTAHLVLLDGGSQLVAWQQAFAHRPTIGERVEFPKHIQHIDPLQEYQASAKVARVLFPGRDASPIIELEAEAQAADATRPTVFLNLSRIPAPLRLDVEALLRRELLLPKFVWQESTEPEAVLHFYEFRRHAQPSFHHLRKCVNHFLNSRLVSSLVA